MNQKGKSIYEQYLEIVSATPEVDTLLLQKHVKNLRESEKYLPIGMTFLFITNSANQKYEFITKNVEHCTGLKLQDLYRDGVNYILSRIHPDETEQWHMIVGEIVNEIIRLPEKQRLKTNFQLHYRLKNGSGKYINISDGHIPIALNNEGIPYLFLSQVTVLGSGGKSKPKGILMCLNENNEYDIIFKTPDKASKEDLCLSKREIEVLNYVGKGLTSKDIAEKIHVSKETVDKHRKNIIKKLDVNNVVEAYSKAKRAELLD
ncbi:LuxR C-terminal-related transcriptional regulator [Mangrovivirga sp. M17]|uniref:LuxR C-terminal-related transcriptional regulator n=1 Tax=Mangrovivirga halotolerans TaxID=2993936 RepID=A0ABT3RNE2_9BACT|nr:LuxR C-terminal-related transcriptional regulator [Mangrovivirga halotolerans]MCX2743043.1 LuxR C-terminal-related transcriptional regulator [Mangrovivirga halotolerans]